MVWFRKNERVNDAFIRLMDALCSWERNTSRGSTLLFVPEEKDEEVILIKDGKPVYPVHYATLISQLEHMKRNIEGRYER